MEKGLFSNLFLLIILVLLTPTFIISNQSINIVDTYNHLNLLTLSVDNVVSDSLMEESFSGCSISNIGNYNFKINDFVSDMISELNEESNIQCSASNVLNSNLIGSDYSGEIIITCQHFNKNVDVLLEKTLYFNKNIDASPGCTITIKDNLDNLNIYATDTR